MIRVIVRVYRFVVVLVFVIGAIATPFILVELGIGQAALWVLAVTALVGVSAVLLSINDYLATAHPLPVARPTSDYDPRKDWIAAAVLGVLVIAYGASLLLKEPEALPSPTAAITDAKGADEGPPNDLDANGCSPKLAASIGLKCE